MDTLKNPQRESFTYTSRYTPVTYYYDTLDEKYVYGIGHNLSKDTPYVAHQVTFKDTLDSLSLKYYNNPTYWWIIAYFNDIQDPLIQLNLHYDVLKIPQISSIEFKDSR